VHGGERDMFLCVSKREIVSVCVVKNHGCVNKVNIYKYACVWIYICVCMGKHVCVYYMLKVSSV
jgi:hypothetical protein